MAMSEFWSEAGNEQFVLMRITIKISQKQPTGATSDGLQIAMHSQLPPLLVTSIFVKFYRLSIIT